MRVIGKMVEQMVLPLSYDFKGLVHIDEELFGVRVSASSFRLQPWKSRKACNTTALLRQSQGHLSIFNAQQMHMTLADSNVSDEKTVRGTSKHRLLSDNVRKRRFDHRTARSSE